MGSLAVAEEDEAAKQPSAPPPPPPRSPFPSPLPQQRHLPLPAPQHQQEWRITHETVINGTTWYHQPPPTPHFNTDSYNPLAFRARYGSFASFASVNFDGAHPLHAYPQNGGSLPNGEISPLPPPINPPYVHWSTSAYMHEYAQAEGPHDSPRGASSGYAPYPGMCSTYRPMPSYAYNVQNQGMPYYPCDGHIRPYMPADYGFLGMRISCPNSMQGTQAVRGSFMADYTSHGMPPHAIRMTGRTSRQIVSWSGMTMPVIITSQAAAVVEWIQRQTGDIFGFDLEWRPNRLKDEDNSVALLQLCGPSDCLIIQLLYTDMIPRMLKEFLSNAKKHLGGVGIRQDVKKLEKDHDLICQGQIELGLLASEKLQRDDLQWRGLKKLVDQVLGMTLVKVKRITMSNWDKEYLDDKQIEYACIDAWAAYAVLQKLMTL